MYKQEPPKQQVLGISGSPRKNGNSDVLLEHVQKGVEALRIQCEKIHLRTMDFQSCIGCERCRKDKSCTGLKDDMTKVYPKVVSSQGLVLLSPAHTYNVSALMKAFIDRMYTFYNFGNDRPRSWSSQLAGQNRKAVLVGVAEQTDPKDMGFTIESMRVALQSLGYEVIDELAVYGIFDRGKVKNDVEVLEKATTLGKTLARSIVA
ncbi:2-amino-4-deoxychorismate dehydrogenase [Anaerohalosphaera lusitana]|uniref:2-amino-4-deoxychorismate dehydrogenase n=1 Tax=Anaerohalosphaera lusitana TaxID=1936003 RepID=A0A1U9NGI4_9BACT|nr:flavodoxin family protein [Anaerohalosphaera lusitana]AQT66867.1 2-amino-4-deoxychorismate dehydrogenase [Anaerohalosphaera lusitana]